MAKKKRINIRRDVFGGEILTRVGFTKMLVFILYIVVLILIYMMLNQVMIGTKRNKSRNAVEIKNLKADYTSKSARLQNQSSRDQIIVKLQQNGSTLKSPVRPAQKIKLEEYGEK